MTLLEQYLLQEKSVSKIRTKMHEYHPYDLAQEFTKLSKIGRMRMYEVLDAKEMADIFEYIDDHMLYINEMYPSYTARVIDEMEADDAADMIGDMKEENRHIMSLLDDDRKLELEQLIAYDEDEAGSAMTTGFVCFDADYDVKDAMKTLIVEAREKEVIDPLFVTSKGVLVGQLSLRELITARAPKKIYEIITEAKAVNHHEKRMVASQMIQDYGLYALAVIDDEDKLLGVITIDDAIDVIEEEASEDYAKMALLTDDEVDTSIFQTLKKRIPWLVLLVLLSFAVSNVLTNYLDVIGQVTVLIFFQTLILDMAGNSGTQSLAVTVRAISKGDFNRKNTVFKHLFKEFRISLVNGILLGILAFIVAFVFLFIRQNGDNIVMISTIISVSMAMTLVISDLLGALLPLFFQKIHIDPAVASGPFISTLNDIISITIYFSLATALLPII